MKLLATYSSYEEANERQLDLLAAEIDATVEYAPPGELSSVTTQLGTYHLLVDEAQEEEACAVVFPAIDPSEKSILHCPKCKGDNVQGFIMNSSIDVFLLMLPSIMEFLISRFRGDRYVCMECGVKFRRKLMK